MYDLKIPFRWTLLKMKAPKWISYDGSYNIMQRSAELSVMKVASRCMMLLKILECCVLRLYAMHRNDTQFIAKKVIY